MPFSPASVAGLCCPCCAGGLIVLSERREPTLRCEGCATEYPGVGAIPCLVPDPALWRATWLSRLTGFLSAASASIRGWRAEAEVSGLPPRTRTRLAQIIAGSEEQCQRVNAFFE